MPQALPTGRLVAWLRPVGYSLALDIDPSADRFAGEAKITVALDRQTRGFVLHGSELQVLSVEVIAGGDRIPAAASTRKSAGSNGPEEELVIVSERPVEPGEAQIHIQYTAPLTESLRGIYRVTEEGRSYVFTQFEPSDARRMFPCFDDPAYKVPFDVKVTVPKGNLVFFNTPEKSRSTVGDNVAFVFEKSQRMPTYLVALAIGPLEVAEGSSDPVPIRVITTPGGSKRAGPALRMAKEHLEVLSEYFGTPYPYAKLDLVAVPNFGAGAMENAGLVTFREEYLLFDEATASAKTKRDVAMTIAHELAHQWFGNLVTMRWWNDLWLNEGFATFMEAAVVDRWRPEMRVDLELLSLAGWVMDVDALSTARAVRNPVENTYQAMEAFDGITYVKGAAFVRMLQAWLGDDAFRQGLKAYMSENAWGNAGADDLFRALSRASSKPVTAVAATFLDVPGVPLVTADLLCSEGRPPRVRLSQMQYSGLGEKPASDRRWQIPVCVAHGQGGKKETTRDCTLLTDRSRELALTAKKCPDWVLPNASYAGYYRFTMPKPQLRVLAGQTLSRDAKENIGFITNLWALVQSGDVEAESLFELLLAYKNEQRREVVEEVIKALTHISHALIEPAARPGFSKFVSALLLPTAKKLGWDARKTDSENDRLMRQAVLSALSLLTDDRWMAREAKRRAAAFLDNPKTMDRDTAKIALKHAARQGYVTFERLSRQLEAAVEPPVRIAIVEALASLSDPVTLRKTLDLLRSGAIRSQDGVYLARAATEHPATRNVLIAWLGEHLEEVANKMPGFGFARMVASASHICDAQARASADKTLGAAITKMGRSKRRLDKALERSALCIDLRDRQASAATAYFAKRRRY